MSETLQIRSNNEAIAEFKKIAEELNITQGAVLDVMIASYNANKTAVNYPNQKNNIEEFYKLIHTVLDMYSLSVEIAENKEQQLNSKYRTEIERLTKENIELGEMRKRVEKAEKEIEKAKNTTESLENQIKSLTAINDSLKQNKANMSELEALEKKIAVLEAEAKLKDEMIEVLRK